MMAVICKTFVCIRDLETYKTGWLVGTSSGFQAYGATLKGTSVIICLEKMRPYAGDFVANNPQKRLDLPKPKLPNGETPPGFLGFAVNMVRIHPANLSFVTPRGHGLRETLFFNLFSHLQVYETRDEMLQALPLIADGAVSLDGGILKSKDISRLRGRAESGLKFPVWRLPEANCDYEIAIKNKTGEKTFSGMTLHE